MLKEKHLNEMVEEQEQKQEEYAHERHMENTKTEQGNGNSQRKCQKNFTITLQHQISQEHIKLFSKYGKQTAMVTVIGTFLQHLSLQIYQMGVCSINNGKDAHAIYFQVLH
jgi:hypothetical protein